MHFFAQSRSVLTIALTILTLIIIASCANAQSPMRLQPHPEKLIIMGDVGEITDFTIEIAQTEIERSKGLMFRTDLPKDTGMLFIFEDVSERFFWMRNTPTPLDIIYADQNGLIVHIAQNTTPFSETPIPSRKPAKFAFEIHAGLSKMLGIAVGDHLKHDVIEKN